MRNDIILRAIGNIDEDLIDRAAPKDTRDKATHLPFAPLLKWVVPIAASLVVVMAITVPLLLKQSGATGGGYAIGGDFAEGGAAPGGGYAGGGAQDTLGDGTGNDTWTGGAAVPSPGLSLDGGFESAACYAALEDWRGLPTENHIIDEQDGGIAADRMVFKTLDDLAFYADAFVLVPSVRAVSQEGTHMQTAIAEYAEVIGDRLNTRQWDDYMVSTSNRVLIRQQLIGGCTFDEPNNLLREGGVYLLPVIFNPDWGAYEVVGDYDVLFELDDEGKMVSHSQWEALNQYDGKSLSELVDDIRALYPTLDTVFIEQPIDTVEQAETQVITAYYASGFRKFTVAFDSEAVIGGVEAYVFKVSFDGQNSEFAAVAKANGAFIRGELQADGEMQTYGGLGRFPW